MLRFIDLSSDYWNEPTDGHALCAFLNTSDNRFITNDAGEHIFSDMDDIESISDKDIRLRAKRLLPERFFDPQNFRKVGDHGGLIATALFKFRKEYNKASVVSFVAGWNARDKNDQPEQPLPSVVVRGGPRIAEENVRRGPDPLDSGVP